jgi:hypothetical protein
MLRRLSPLTFALLALLWLGAPAEPARADATRTDGARLQLQRLKELQHQAMLREPLREHRERMREMREARRHRGARKAGDRMRPLSEPMQERLREAARQEYARKAGVAAVNGVAAALAPNRMVNNPAGDQFTAAQSEVSIAVDGSHCVAAWNDGQGYFVPNGQLQGFAWSNDDGVTWHDGGAPPTNGGVTRWLSDPLVTVNEKTHKFYFSALCLPNATNNGVGVVEGSFGGAQDTLQWGTPSVARTVPNSTVQLDKEWIAADSASGRLHLIYARFVISGGSFITNHIDYQVAATPGAATWGWSAPTQLSSAGDAGYVQGARVGVGPAGEVYATWFAIGQLSNSAWGRDYLRIRKSTTFGASFGAQVTVDSLFSNFGAGAPGFNRPTAIGFPGMATDRTDAATRGRVYLTWPESINFYFDALGATGYVLESESNGTAGTADVFSIGNGIHGQILSSDVDYWRFNGTAGQTIVVFADTVDPALDLQTELLCTDGTTEMSYSENGTGWFTLNVFTLPATGTYYLRVSAADGFSTGPYTIETGPHVNLGGQGADRARDHRDIYVKYSADGVSWPVTPKLASTEVARFDDFLPEIAIAGDGTPYVAWYAFHDAPPGVCLGCGANTYLTRSDDGGATYLAGSPVTDTTTVWWNVQSNILPNMGDYIALFANGSGIYVGWADGRRVNPDVFMAKVPLNFTATTVSLVRAEAAPDRVAITWLASQPGMSATIERRAPDADWAAVATLVADGTGRLAFEDHAVTAGARYGYRVAVAVDGATQRFGETWVDVPSAAVFALRGAQPNPSAGTMHVAFALPNAAPARLEVLDIGGRRIAEREVGSLGAGSHVLDVGGGRPLPPGVYLIRLTRGGQTLISRATIIR